MMYPIAALVSQYPIHECVYWDEAYERIQRTTNFTVRAFIQISK